MKKFLSNLLHDENGAETAEWLIIVALIATVGLGVYTNILLTALSTAVTSISDFISNTV
jgi:Flp pilus assembly pilin Flp